MGVTRVLETAFKWLSELGTQWLALIGASS